MSLDNNSANNFKDFLEAIKPYLNYQLYDCSGMGIDAFRFSATEKPVGQWTDGKLIYQKTVDCGTMPNNTVKTVAHGIQNLDKVVRIEGIGKTSAAFVTMPCLNVTNVNAQIEITVDATNIYCNTKADRTGFGNVFITLLYTKTTDSPLANDEKFAGVWIDGSPMFEKIIHASNIAMGNNANVKVGTIAGYNFVTVDNATVINAVGACFVNSNWIGVNIDENGNVYAKQTFSQSSQTCEVYITIRYTKTS